MVVVEDEEEDKGEWVGCLRATGEVPANRLQTTPARGFCW